MLESSHYIVYHSGDKDNHHAKHYRGTEPGEQVDEKHGAAQKFTKGEEERNGGYKKWGQNLVFSDDKTEKLQIQEFFKS